MTSEPEFLPAAPRPLEPRLGLQLLERSRDVPAFLAELRRRGGVIVEDDPTAGTATVTVACGRRGDAERVVLVLDTLTHMHRTNLEPFALREAEHRGQRLHLGAFKVPRGLRTGLGLLRLRDGGLGVGRSRPAWKQALSAVRAPEQDSTEVFRSLDGSTSILLALPGASPQPATDHLGAAPRSRPLVESAWTSQAFGVGVRAWATTPSTQPVPAVTLVAADGNQYAQAYPLAPGLQHAEREGIIPPTSLVMFAPEDPGDRARMLGMSADLPVFLSEELIPWAEREGVAVAPPAQRAFAGASLGGLAAADLVRRAPEVVSRGIVQSASFWWPDDDPDTPEGLQLRLWDEQADDLRDKVRIFHEVGVMEGHLRADNRAFVELLRRHGIDHSAREYMGGHDYVCWRGGIVDGLAWLFPSGDEAPRA